MRILIAEDDPNSRALLTTALTKAGYEPVVTADGVAAWAELQKPDAPKIAIIDWIMPEMDGVNAARRARAMPTNQPPYILMLTGRSQSDDIAAGLGAGANDYPVKLCNCAADLPLWPPPTNKFRPGTPRQPGPFSPLPWPSLRDNQDANL